MTPWPAALAAKAASLRRTGGRMIVLGLAGPQGSGKSTAARAIAETLQREGLRTAILSLDDLYLSRTARQALASRIHPLLQTRGPPGTHDVALGLRLLEALKTGAPVALPRFDKASDDRRPKATWPASPPEVDVVVFEGWCVGARPQAEVDLAAPINALEAQADPEGVWRRFCNTALAGDYQTLFAAIDLFALIRAPRFDVVAGWRTQQERDLGPRRFMDDAEINRFVQHYQRVTEWMAREAADRADVRIDLGADRGVVSVRGL